MKKKFAFVMVMVMVLGFCGTAAAKTYTGVGSWYEWDSVTKTLTLDPSLAVSAAAVNADMSKLLADVGLDMILKIEAVNVGDNKAWSVLMFVVNYLSGGEGQIKEGAAIHIIVTGVPDELMQNGSPWDNIFFPKNWADVLLNFYTQVMDYKYKVSITFYGVNGDDNADKWIEDWMQDIFDKLIVDGDSELTIPDGFDPKTIIEIIKGVIKNGGKDSIKVIIDGKEYTLDPGQLSSSLKKRHGGGCDSFGFGYGLLALAFVVPFVFKRR